MKRVWLIDDDGPILAADGETCRTNPALVRAASVALAMHATGAPAGRIVGDPVFESVTECRQSANQARRAAGSPERAYSSCGDLAHWVLTMLGCRDESLVNRTDDGGSHPWSFVGARNNISILDGSPLKIRAAQHPDENPGDGDILFLNNPSGGHVCVVRRWSNDEQIAWTEDYGQPYARSRTRKLERHPASPGISQITLDSLPLIWWLPITSVPLARAAIVPDTFTGGQACNVSAEIGADG